MTISPEQCRAARGLVNWSQSDLAKAADMARSTVTDFERGAREPIPNNLTAIRSVLEAAGVEFIPENGGGLGVRFRQRGQGAPD
jgi:transcriptional regulator with XRE-family HTH domain